MSLIIVEWKDFTSEQQNLILFAFEKNKTVVLSPGHDLLQKYGLYPTTDKSGVMVIPNFQHHFHFEFESCTQMDMTEMDPGEEMKAQWMMTLKPNPIEGNNEIKVRRALKDLRADKDPSFIYGITMNVPEFFEDKGFMDWVNNDQIKFARHKKGEEAGEWSEIIVTIDPSLSGNGSECADADFPEWCWEVIMSEARRRISPESWGNCNYIARLTNYRD